jgi:hypothetical protein
VADKDDITDAIEDITTTTRPGPNCWATRLPEDAYEFLLLLEKLERDPIEQVDRKIAAGKFWKLFRIDVSAGKMLHHLNQGCSCKWGRDY